MKIRIDKTGNEPYIDPYRLAQEIESDFRDSRFTFTLDITSNSKSAYVNIGSIRLKESKPYCGNHPAMCEATGRTPRRAKYLEGADWVEFNDLLNDTCDRLYADCEIKSAACQIRDGRRRRIKYGYIARTVQNDWTMYGDMVSDYEDWCGVRAPMSIFPDGTPGIYSRNNANYSCIG